MSIPEGRWAVMAIAAHADDIEFMMAGTLLLLKQAGAEIHMWNLCNGSCGSEVYDAETIARMRWDEAQASAAIAGATMHPPLVKDLELMYDVDTLQKVAGGIRQVKPLIVLTHNPQDYMEDHQNAGRLATTGAFTRALRNFPTQPPTDSWAGETVVYHCLPHSLCDPLRQPIQPELYVNIDGVLDTKKAMLGSHKSQKDWLDATQGMGSYVDEMVRLGAHAGSQSGKSAHAEAWRRHLNLGFARPGYDPLSEALGELVHHAQTNAVFG